MVSIASRNPDSTGVDNFDYELTNFPLTYKCDFLDFVNSPAARMGIQGCANFNQYIGRVLWDLSTASLSLECMFYVLGRFCQLSGECQGCANFNYIILSSHPKYYENQMGFVNRLTDNQVDGFHDTLAAPIPVRSPSP